MTSKRFESAADRARVVKGRPRATVQQPSDDVRSKYTTEYNDDDVAARRADSSLRTV